MAFFKFRQSGQSQPAARTRADESAAGGPAETIESLRRRARHRLIGAAVLVLAAIIGFPLLFDTQPRPVAVNAPITIPDRDGARPLRIPEPARGTSVPAASSLDDKEEMVAHASHGAAAASRPADKSDARTESAAQAEAAARAKREEEARARRDEEVRARREADARAKREEAARARAALEGRRADKPVDGAADSGRFIVQIGAFAEAEKVREARQQAERAGLKTYVQVVDTKEGKRTRVRAGPYATRAEAEKAAAALQKAGLTGGIYAL
ncbi:SPOR domain-containing protein [Ottowia sp.]|jgi:DedD protein|uniref:SPOR domain-containing protein n=1 Tax=Ottowia sp. TaxID=1898956 RepID=UPI0025ED6AE9|nr:SPOR domain-containing protein [Ottowia sp.]MBK6615842.1 SPOR domain-containing protein [Ottowia sp.]MBK6746890.1 SPOR domain-containing protein [Ottowia sp.]